MTAQKLVDPRQAKNTRHQMVALLRQAVYGRLAGYEDTNDVERLRADPAMCYLAGGKAEKSSAASTSEMVCFEVVCSEAMPIRKARE